MAVTPFLKLQLPPFDTIPWDQAVNGNMSVIDAWISQFMSVPNYAGAWANSTAYTAGQNVLDVSNALIYTCQVTHTSAPLPTTFSSDRAANPSYWTQTIAGTPMAGVYAPVVSPTFSGDPKAPTPAPTDNDTSIATTQFVQSLFSSFSGATGHNLVHNPQFTVAQRGTGPFTVGGYTLDRWLASVNIDTISFSRQPLTDTHRAQIGDEEAQFALANTFAGSSNVAALTAVQQRVEDVHRLAGKIVTISFWAMATAGTPKFGVNLVQSFGSGGSPSSAVGLSGQAVTLSTTFTRYALTFSAPSVAGKVFGSNNDSSTNLNFWYSAGANSATQAGSVGVQTGTIWIWGVQLEIGSQATILEKRTPEDTLAACQRFFCAWICGVTTNTTAALAAFTFPVQMRATPTFSGIALSQGTGATFTPINTRGGFQAANNSLAAYATGLASADL